MSLAARLIFLFCGLVAVAYSAANLAGAITPPWWEREEVIVPRHKVGSGRTWEVSAVEPRSGREAISVGVGAVGLAALAFAAWPRRRKAATP